MYPPHSGAAAYSKVGMETGVTSADPHKLILMLFEGAILAVTNARMHMTNHQISQKGAAISHAISIIDNGLKASLDMNVGGEIAQNLSLLYDYMSQRLLLANINNDPAALDEVKKLLSDLKGAWEQIGNQPAPAAPAPSIDEAPKRSGASYGQA